MVLSHDSGSDRQQGLIADNRGHEDLMMHPIKLGLTCILIFLPMRIMSGTPQDTPEIDGWMPANDGRTGTGFHVTCEMHDWEDFPGMPEHVRRKLTQDPKHLVFEPLGVNITDEDGLVYSIGHVYVETDGQTVSKLDMGARWLPVRQNVNEGKWAAYFGPEKIYSANFFYSNKEGLFSAWADVLNYLYRCQVMAKPNLHTFERRPES